MVIFEKAVRTTSESIILPDCFTESKRSSTKEQIGILEGSQLTSSQYLRAPALSVHNFILKIQIPIVPQHHTNLISLLQ
jgi:hypothetical protein